MRCTKCGSENPDSKQFCSDCGTPFGSRCPKCSAENPVGKKFCGDCGTALANKASIHIPTTHTAETSAPEIRMRPEQQYSATADGERKTITALFADIKGSTELMRDLDPEEARAIVDPVLRLMMAAVHRYGGYVAQSTGDGIFALFGAPVAHEDHPQRALYAALAMQEELRRYADRLRNEGKIPVEARVGVNTGEVVVRSIETGGHTEYTPIGHVTNLAARMQTAAPAGSIAASEATRQPLRGLLRVPDARADSGKGTQRPCRGVRGGARRAAADALPARGAARADADSSGVSARWRRWPARWRSAHARATGRSSPLIGRGGRGQVAPVVRVQGHSPGPDAKCWKLTRSRTASRRPSCRCSSC